MGSGKRLVIPTIIILVMVALLSVIGWLAYVFFNTLSERPVEREPFFAVVTSGVQRVRQRAPQSIDEVILADSSTATNPPSPVPPASSVNTASDVSQSPAVCLDYDPAITEREAWNNPLEYQASVSPNRVRIAVIMPEPTQGVKTP